MGKILEVVGCFARSDSSAGHARQGVLGHSRPLPFLDLGPEQRSWRQCAEPFNQSGGGLSSYLSPARYNERRMVMSDSVYVTSEARKRIVAEEFDYRKVTFGPETRSARLYTEIIVDGKRFSFEAAGAGGCSVNSLNLNNSRGSLVYNLACDLTYFHSSDTPLGEVTIIDDPRRPILGSIILRRNQEGQFELPGLSFFNQYLIFHIGDKFFYYPSPWQVISALLAWPPEYHQYHHLEEDTPIFDFNTRTPNVARKGISTISIEAPHRRKNRGFGKHMRGRLISSRNSQVTAFLLKGSLSPTTSLNAKQQTGRVTPVMKPKPIFWRKARGVAPSGIRPQQYCRIARPF